jgi:hypothetical protein
MGQRVLSEAKMLLQSKMGSDPSPPRNLTPVLSRAPSAGLRRHEKHNRQGVEGDGRAQGETEAGSRVHRIATSGHLLQGLP